MPAVGGQLDPVGITSLVRFTVLHRQQVGDPAVVSLFFQAVADVAAVPRRCFQNFEGKVFFRNDRDRLLQLRAGRTVKSNVLRGDGDNLLDAAAHAQLEHGAFGIVGVDMDLFAQPAPPIATCIDLDGDFTLLPGRNVSRKRDRRAASAGPDPADVQRCVALILQHKIVKNFLAVNDRFKPKDANRDICDRP